MVRVLIEIHGELMQIGVKGADVEHMYNALIKLTDVIRTMQEENNKGDTDEHGN